LTSPVLGNYDLGFQTWPTEKRYNCGRSAQKFYGGKMKFDPYEYIGVIVPGSVVLFAASLLYKDFIPALNSTLSLGDFGLVLILAFVAGHIVQAGGNLWESVIWHFFGGMPTSWVGNEKNALLTEKQTQRLSQRLESDFEATCEEIKNGRGPTREIVARIQKDGGSERIEKFNRNYGLMRGIAVAFGASAVLAVIKNPEDWKVAALLFGIAAVATYRMARFGIHYAREVYVVYLTLR